MSDTHNYHQTPNAFEQIPARAIQRVDDETSAVTNMLDHPLHYEVIRLDEEVIRIKEAMAERERRQTEQLAQVASSNEIQAEPVETTDEMPVSGSSVVTLIPGVDETGILNVEDIRANIKSLEEAA